MNRNYYLFFAFSLFACTSKENKSDLDNPLDTTKMVALNTVCDCKKYALEKKIELPSSDDLFMLSDSMRPDSPDGDQSFYTEYGNVMKKVTGIRSKYDLAFKDCYAKFGDLDVVTAPCSPEEKTINAFNKAMSLIKRNCNGSNQELVKYMATKVEGVVVFMFMSVGGNGMVCISGVSEINPDEILSTDCGEANTKMAEWDAMPELKISLR